VRTRYFIRVDPPPDEGEAPRVPPELRQRLLDALSARFEPTLLPHWEAISITSIPTDRAGSDSNKEMHRRLGQILDEADPGWKRHYILVPYFDAWPQPDRTT
jgi:hypothetical protein